ncbi:MAG: ATP-binding protein [Lachnospiraceae bacterium]|nr:ATP-binding protein [Lachnospiraceae bacterium]
MQDYAIIGALKLSYFLKDKINDEAFKHYARVLKSDVTKQMLYSATKSECNYDRYSTEIIKYRYKKIFEPCKKNKIAMICIELAILEYIDNSVNEIFKIITGNNERGVSLDLATKIAYPDELSVYFAKEIDEAKQIIEKILVYEAIYPDYIRNTYRMDITLMNYLNGIAESVICNNLEVSGSKNIGQGLSKNFGQYIRFHSYKDKIEELVLYTDDMMEICKRVERIAKSNEMCPVVHIIGERQTGKKFLVRHISKQLKHNVLIYEYEEPANGEEFVRLCQKIKRCMYLLESGLCIDIPEKFEMSEKNLKVRKNIIKIIKKIGGTSIFRNRSEKENIEIINDGENLELFVISDKNIKIHPYIDNAVCQFEMKKLNEIQSRKVWKTFICASLGENALHKINISEMAAKMNISIGNIKKIVQQMKYSGEDLIYDNRYISKLCYQALNDGRYDDIKHMDFLYQWEDLKLEVKQKSKIMDIYFQIKYKLKVYNEYGMKRHFQYGRCVSALFSGPSGTGKTMAVYVLANMLNLELYKVDLSKVVDKYIGETEKRLEEIFRKAEQSNMILFFDEADALFGKRSEVNDARDKYANTEVAYLLQRIEEFDGIVILATNYRENIDAAFMRRIKFEVRFTIPDKNIRYEIWKSVFGKKMKAEDIDFEYLSENFEFTGATIKNVVLNAVFKSVSQEIGLNMKHIIWAIQSEYEKNGKMVFKEEFGKYGYLIAD